MDNESKLQWFRFYSEAIRDDKFIMISQEYNIPFLSVIGAWVIILSIASESPERGKLLATLQKRFCNNHLKQKFIADDDTTEKILKAFIEYELIEIEEEVYEVRNWNKRQYKSDSSTGRSQKSRENKSCNVAATLQECCSNAPETDTDTDTETETEEEDVVITTGLSPFVRMSSLIGKKLNMNEMQPITGQKKWNDAITQIVGIPGLQECDIDAGIKYMHDNQWTISGPWSVAKPIEIAAAKRQAEASSPGSTARKKGHKV